MHKVRQTTDKVKNFKQFVNENSKSQEFELSDMVNELENIQNSTEFKQWLDVLDGKQYSSKFLTRELLINGYCEDLAVYLKYKYGFGDILSVDDRQLPDGHYFLGVNGRLYDSMNPHGVTRPSQFEWSKRLMQNHPEIKPDMLDRIRSEWDGLPAYRDAIQKFFGPTAASIK